MFKGYFDKGMLSMWGMLAGFIYGVGTPIFEHFYDAGIFGKIESEVFYQIVFLPLYIGTNIFAILSGYPDNTIQEMWGGAGILGSGLITFMVAFFIGVIGDRLR